MLSRRALLQLAATTPVLGHLAAYFGLTNVAASPLARDYFKELGLRPFINAAGTFTMLTASQMPDEVTQAIRYASTRYVRLDDIQDAVGARIATLLRCEAATVTAGAASALTLGTAGVPSAKVVSFASMATAAPSGGTRLAQVRAVSPGYPYYGDVITGVGVAALGLALFLLPHMHGH